ncbi:MAG: M20/M25/M40 family metallo-hydrolase [Microbacteriaceae bacterium]|nr:M20/M25/M40 family metallo-hydrolase [Microbacteriaceae bacterium]MCL2794751.1 M20/M25/M40 family metallo-hydrolase [Microbacteriaceae bacterium]
MSDDAVEMPEVEDASPPRPGIEHRLSRLIQLDTVSSTVVARGAAEFEELLAESWPLVHTKLRKEKLGERGILFHWGEGTEPLVLMAHFDTVPTGDPARWRHPPLSGEIADGTVHGRGAIDDKGALVVLLDAVENLLAAGEAPARPVIISLGGDEETYGDAARTIADELHARGIRPWLVLDEGGAIIDGPLPGLAHETAVIGVAEKGVLSVRMSATSAPGHSSTPGRTPSAPERIAKAITRMRKNPFPKRLDGTTKQLFDAYRPVATTAAGRAVSTLVPRLGPVAARIFAALGGEPAALVQTTVTTTVLASGDAHNVIPESANAVLNLRIAPGETIASCLGVLRHAVRDPGIEFEVIEGHDPSPASRTDSPQWHALAQAVTDAYPGVVVAPYVMLAASDARHFHHHTPDATYRLSPLRMSRAERAALHGIDERVTVDALVRGERFYRHLLMSA